jgi:AcrR family transcriptional regulator
VSDDTKPRIVQAALQTLRTRGFAGASAREIAAAGAFNQALIFYHFGSVQNALLAALDLVSDRRMEAYRPVFERARTVPELAALARSIFDEDLQNGYVTVLVEMVAGGVSDPELGKQVIARVEPWIEMVQRKLGELVARTPLEAALPTREAAFAMVALYLGLDMLSQLDGDHGRATSLLDLAVQYAPLAQALAP